MEEIAGKEGFMKEGRTCRLSTTQVPSSFEVLGAKMIERRGESSCPRNKMPSSRPERSAIHCYT